MTKGQATKLINRLREQGHEAEVYEEYSGRCMYGQTTTGVVTDAHPTNTLGSRSKHRWDNLGLRYIIY